MPKNSCIMQIWAESGKSALPICNYSQILYQFLTFTQNLKRSHTFDEAVRLEPDAHPLFHSDRGFQYTSMQFYTRLKKNHMKQSMSRVAHCIDNGPMEGFWGILKREMYYRQHFNDRSTLVAAIANYINYYNNQRLQRNLNVMTPMEYHNQYIKVA